MGLRHNIMVPPGRLTSRIILLQEMRALEVTRPGPKGSIGAKLLFLTAVTIVSGTMNLTGPQARFRGRAILPNIPALLIPPITITGSVTTLPARRGVKGGHTSAGTRQAGLQTRPRSRGSTRTEEMTRVGTAHPAIRGRRSPGRQPRRWM